MTNKKLIILLLWGLCFLNTEAKDKSPLVTILCDSVTLQKSGDAIEAYAESIRNDGKRCSIFIDKWGQPDSIKTFLKSLYLSDSMEGAVLIGDIPVAMIRDAQHLSTAFKMDQNRPLFESSIPSDRFYDDFDLKFDYLNRDEEHPGLYYYSLRADSPQYISCDIYTARIKAPVMPGMTKYEAISSCLHKITAEKRKDRRIKNIFYFSGHGYNSESLQARVDETSALNHHFGRLSGKGDTHISFMNYNRDNFVKDRFQAALADTSIDIALLHHHGAEDTQYLSATPYANTPGLYIEYLKRFVRTKVRSAKDTTEIKQYYIDTYGIPEEWTEGAGDKKLTEEDESFAAAMDVSIADTYGKRSGARFIMHDACFNGSFHLDDYIAGHYLFNPGTTVVVKGNSVNTLQDTWPLEMIGLLDEGVCVGNWLRGTMTLESHIMGDPTYRFCSSGNGEELDRAIVLKRMDTKFWRKELRGGSTDRRTLAISILAQNGAISGNELLGILQNDNDPIVRMEAFNTICKYRYGILTDAMIAGMHDSYELLERISTLKAAKNGDERLLPHLAEMYFDPTLSERIEFHIQTCFGQYEYTTVENIFAAMRAEHPYWPTDKRMKSLLASLKRSETMSDAEFEKLSDDSLTFRKRRLTVSSQRNACSMKYVAPMLSYLSSGDNQELRLLIAETLGWYVYSPASGEIIESLKAQIPVEKNEKVCNEMIKTINRLDSEYSRLNK